MWTEIQTIRYISFVCSAHEREAACCFIIIHFFQPADWAHSVTRNMKPYLYMVAKLRCAYPFCFCACVGRFGFQRATDFNDLLGRLYDLLKYNIESTSFRVYLFPSSYAYYELSIVWMYLFSISNHSVSMIGLLIKVWIRLNDIIRFSVQSRDNNKNLSQFPLVNFVLVYWPNSSQKNIQGQEINQHSQWLINRWFKIS